MKELKIDFKDETVQPNEVVGKISEKKTTLEKDMDKLSASLRDMEDGQEKEDKRKEYRDMQQDLVDKLVEFYNGILEGLDGGVIVIENGAIKRAATEGEEGLEHLDHHIVQLLPRAPDRRPRGPHLHGGDILRDTYIYVYIWFQQGTISDIYIGQAGIYNILWLPNP